MYSCQLMCITSDLEVLALAGVYLHTLPYIFPIVHCTHILPFHFHYVLCNRLLPTGKCSRTDACILVISETIP